MQYAQSSWDLNTKLVRYSQANGRHLGFLSTGPVFELSGI